MTVKKIVQSQLSDVQSLRLRHDAALQNRTNKTGFADLMQEEIQKESVHFSKHAESRIRQRGIEVSDDMLASLNQAVQKAREKGAKDTVIIGSQGAFIVNVPNNIVVTTMSQQEMQNNIFTNIDSAVLM